jgi:hypothetical protein
MMELKELYAKKGELVTQRDICIAKLNQIDQAILAILNKPKEKEDEQKPTKK